MLKKVLTWLGVILIVAILYGMSGSGYAMGQMLGGWIREAFAFLEGIFDGAV